MPGVGVIKVYFHPNTEIAGAVAQVTAVSQTLLRTMPPGTTPPLILQYSASSVPILSSWAIGGRPRVGVATSSASRAEGPCDATRGLSRAG